MIEEMDVTNSCPVKAGLGENSAEGEAAQHPNGAKGAAWRNVASRWQKGSFIQGGGTMKVERSGSV